MTYMAGLPMRDRIAQALTELDRKRSATDRHWNRYFIGLALQALEGFEEDAGRNGPEVAFAERFTPSREMAAVVRRVGLDLKVDRGRWVMPNGRTV